MVVIVDMDALDKVLLDPRFNPICPSVGCRKFEKEVVLGEEGNELLCPPAVIGRTELGRCSPRLGPIETGIGVADGDYRKG